MDNLVVAEDAEAMGLVASVAHHPDDPHGTEDMIGMSMRDEHGVKFIQRNTCFLELA